MPSFLGVNYSEKVKTVIVYSRSSYSKVKFKKMAKEAISAKDSRNLTLNPTLPSGMLHNKLTR